MQESWILETSFSDRYQSVNFLYRQTFTMEMHCHAYWQIIVVTEGTLEITSCSSQATAAKETRCLAPGMIHFLPPGHFHALYSPDGYTQLGIDLLPGNTPLSDLLATHLAETFTLTSDHLPALVAEITTLYPAATQLTQFRMQHLLDSLLLHCLDRVLNCRTSELSSLQKWANEFSTYLNTHLDAPLRLPDIAGYFYISTPQLERRCRAGFRCGVMSLLKQYRFHRARQLLISTDLPIREIGIAVGYPDAAHFSDFFRSMAGVSPKVYRAESRRYA